MIVGYVIVGYVIVGQVIVGQVIVGQVIEAIEARRDMVQEVDGAHEQGPPEGRRSPVIVGISGSSGAVLACRTVEVLGELGIPVHLTYTAASRQVWPDELGRPLQDDLAAWKQRFGVRVFNPDDFRAPVSSGSFLTAGMIVIPCSMRTVSAIAHGSSSNLLERAADVVLKEQRRLVLVPREAPLSAIHLENLLILARLGVRIVPPVPQFYLRPPSFEAMVDAIVRRSLAALGIEEALPTELRWRGDEA